MHYRVLNFQAKSGTKVKKVFYELRYEGAWRTRVMLMWLVVRVWVWLCWLVGLVNKVGWLMAVLIVTSLIGPSV